MGRRLNVARACRIGMDQRSGAIEILGIAEDVNEEFPDLCLYDQEGRPETVKYHELPALLLKEIQRLSERVSYLEARV